MFSFRILFLPLRFFSCVKRRKQLERPWKDVWVGGEGVGERTAPAVAAHPSPHQKAAKTAKASKTKEKQGKANAEVEKNVKPMEM